MHNLKTVDLKAFVPAKDFELSKRFYQDFGFTMASDEDGIAFFHHGNCRFLLQDFYQEQHANNFMMHLLVKEVTPWHRHLKEAWLAEKYGIEISDIVRQPWMMLDFTVTDPSGVLWRIAENLEL